MPIVPFPVDLPPPMLELANTLGVRPEDITEQFIRGSGKGGQKINKTASCVLLKHVPTGIEVRCQEYREQSTNRKNAYKLLIRKIEDKKLGRESKRAQAIFKLRKQKKRRSKKAKQKMLDAKKHRGAIKEMRRPVG